MCIRDRWRTIHCKQPRVRRGNMGEALRKHRVLVVEDEDSIALALDYLMTREGYDLSLIHI